MAILAIDRYFVGDPNIVGIVTDNSLDEITTAGFWQEPETVASIAALQNGAFVMTPTDMVLIYYSPNQIGFFQFDLTTNSFVDITSTDTSVSPGQVQRMEFNTGVDTGTADNYAVALDPVIIAYTNSLIVSFTPANANLTTSPTLNINGMGPKTITRGSGPVQADDLDPDTIAYCIFSTAADEFTLINPFQGWSGGGGVTAAQVQQSAFNFGVDSGSINSYAVTLSPAISSYTNGLLVAFLPTHTNDAITATLSVNGMSAKQILPPSRNFSFVGLGEISTSSLCYVQYDATRNGFVLLDPPVSTTNAAQILSGTNYWTASDEGSSANNYVVTLDQFSPFAPLGLEPIFIVMTATANSNTGSSTMTITDDVGGPWSIVDPKGNALVGGDILAGKSYMFYFNQTAYVLLNPSSTTAVTATQVQQSAFNFGIESGTSTDYVLTLDPPISSYTDGLIVAFRPSNNNTATAATLNVDGVGQKPIIANNVPNGRLAIGDINTAQDCYLIYSQGSDYFTLLTPCITNTMAYDIMVGDPYWRGSDQSIAPNDYSVNLAIMAAYASVGGSPCFVFLENVANTNTGASTLSVPGAFPSSSPIVSPLGDALVGGELLSGKSYFLFFDQNKYYLMNPSVISKFVTAPPASSAPAISLGTAFQNTLGYDAVFTVYLSITAATAADIVLGVDNNNTPSTQTIMSGITVAAQDLVSVPIYIPNGYYCLLDTSGTITLTISGQIAMPV